jgi:DNA repair exonuclease SbcCD ATPase subunit
MISLDELRKKVTSKQAAWNAIRRKVVEERGALEQLEARVQAVLEAQELAQQVAQQVQQQAHDQIASVVSQCLEAVFDEPYTFKIHFDRKRGRTEARLVFERDGLEVDPLTAAGGGVVDVAAFALRLSCLMLAQPPLRKLLALDEPFRFVSAEYLPRVRQLLEKLAEDTGVQFVIITHIEELKTGTVIELD